MKTLLLDESPLLVLPSLAVAVGLNEAIFLQQLNYWLTPSEGWQPHYRVYEGVKRPWIFNTYERKEIIYTDREGNEQTRVVGWGANFPFWSTRTIMRIVTTLKNKGIVIVTDKFNRNPLDKTQWYTIDYDTLSVTLHSDKLSLSKVTDCHPANCQPVTMIPYTTTEINNRENNHKGPNWDGLNFWGGNGEITEVEIVLPQQEPIKAQFDNGKLSPGQVAPPRSLAGTPGRYPTPAT